MVAIENKVITPNDKQRECIETIKGPVMVLAGPGTGKTFTIIQRIKYMLSVGIEPASILCLTYSEAAANEMKGRLVKEIGTVAAAVTVNTYHAFCNEVIRQYPNEFELLDGVSLADEITKRTIMTEVLDEIKPVSYRTKWGDFYYFIPELLSVVDEIKSSRVSKEQYFHTLKTHPQWQGKLDELTEEYQEREQKGKLVKTFLNSFESHKKKMNKAVEAWQIFEAYDIALKKNNFIDFNDMINLVLNEFDVNEELLKKVSSHYKYFLVDEYQDTNYSQNKIVFDLALGANSNNIFVVGDDDQIIYEFQGAKTDTLEKFLLLYPQTKVICLNENNRSTQNILNFSYSVISQDKTRLEFNEQFKVHNINKKLEAKNEEIISLNKKIEVHGFADIKQEVNYVVSEIEKLVDSDLCPKKKSGEKDLSKIAVLTRENGELSTFAKLLESKNIQYQVKANKSIFDIRSSIVLYFYLQSLENNFLYSDKLFGLLLSKPFAFDLIDYNFLLEQNRLNHKDLITNIRLNLDTHNWENKGIVSKFIEDFESLRKIKSCENIKNLIVDVVNKTGILEYFVDSEVNRTENIYAIKKIIDEAGALLHRNPTSSLSDFIKYVETAFSSNIPILIDKEEYTQNAIQLVTLHGSKGREFEYVFIPNLISKKWEGKRTSKTMSLPIEDSSIIVDEEQARKSEQLRLLFVGITRAKHSLMLSFSNSIDGNPQELTSYLSEAIKDESIVKMENHELSQQELEFEIAESIKKSEFDYKTAFEAELKGRIKEFIMSHSSLSSYSNCPRNFFYSEILKIPVYDEDSSNAVYGSAIHKTLEMAVNYAKETGMYPTKEDFIKNFKTALATQKLESLEKRLELEERGQKYLDNYYSYFIQIPSDRVYATEFYLNHVPFEKYFIKGFVDRIEKNSDGTFELYDYKTGGAKPKSQIADGREYESYLNQLRFYKYAFETLNPNSKVSRSGIIFVEEPEKNYYIELTDVDNQLIKEKIKSAYENIFSLSFDAVEKDESTCKYCKYKQLCNLDLF